MARIIQHHILVRQGGLIAFTSTYAAATRLEIPLSFVNESIAQTRQPSGRIAYGQLATSASQFPFMARLAWDSDVGRYTACGGTVLSPYYILTAAHCLYNIDNTLSPPNLVLLGGTDISSFSNFAEKIEVAQEYVPPQYQPDKVNSIYDVAVLRLKTPTSYPAVTLASTAPIADTSVTNIGWGLTQDFPRRNNSLLHYASLKIGTWGSSSCPPCGQSPCPILCEVGIVQTNGGYSSSCRGDSGGPAMLSGTTTQVGIVSYGPLGCGNGTWGGSTSVAEVKSFIDPIIGTVPSPPPPSPPLPSPSPPPPSPPTSSPSPPSPPPPSPSPSPSPSPTPSLNPPPSVCALNRGEIVRITIKAPTCTTAATKAAATAAAEVSGARAYCIVASKCRRISGGRIRINAKIAINSDRSKAKRKITKAFKSGAYSTKFESLLPASLRSKYIFQNGRVCIYPSSRCTY